VKIQFGYVVERHYHPNYHTTMKTTEIIEKVTGNPAKYRLTHRNSLTAPAVGHWRFEWNNGNHWGGHGISSMTAKAALKQGTWADEKHGNIDPFTAYTFTPVNPFHAARDAARDSGQGTIGDMIRLLVDAFSQEGSGDTFGTYILEEAAKEVKAREPERKAEWDAIMARIKESQEAYEAREAQRAKEDAWAKKERDQEELTHG